MKNQTKDVRITNYNIIDWKITPSTKDPTMTKQQQFLHAANTGDLATFLQILNDNSIDPNHADEYGNTALTGAAEHGQSNIVRALLTDQRFDPNLSNKDGETALMLASGQGHAAAVEVLLTHERIDPNLINKLGWTALIQASQNGHAKVVAVLLSDTRTNPNLVNKGGETALLRAVHTDHDDVIKVLLANAHTDPNIKSENNWTALTAASAKGYTEAVKAILADTRTDTEVTAYYGSNALIIAAKHVSKELPNRHTDAVVKAILSDGRIDPNLSDRAGWTALMRAVDTDRDDVIKELLADPRTDPNIKSDTERAALTYASVKGYTEAVKAILADTRTDPNILDLCNWTALMHAVRTDHDDVIKELLADPHTDPNIKSDTEWAALTYASAKGHTEAVKALLTDPRTDTEITDSDGSNALMLAAKNGHTAAITALLADARTNPNLTDIAGQTALTAASAKGYTEAVKALLADKRVDPNLINKYGRTALHYAKKTNHNDVLEILILDARVIKTLDCEKVTSLLTKQTSDLTLKTIILVKPYLTHSILSHSSVNKKSRTELLKHCENIDFFAPDTEGNQELIQFISKNTELFEKRKVPKAFTQTTATHELVPHLKVLQNLFKMDSLPTFEKHIQTWGPLLSKQTLSFFEQLNERDKEDLITYIHEWYTLYSTSSVLNAQGDFSEVIACVKKDHRGNWSAVLAAHKTYIRLRDKANLHDYKLDVQSFLENLERSFYIKTYGRNLNVTEFNEAIQDHYKSLCQKAQQAGTKIQTNYMKTAREDVHGHLKTNYPKFLERNEQALSYSFIEQEKESPIYCQITHTGPKQPGKVMDINLDLKERTLRTPQKIPFAFSTGGTLTELLSLHTILSDNDNISEKIGEKTFSCLRVCCKHLIGKDLPVTVTNLQNLLDALQNDPKRTKMSCLLWSCSQPEPSQTNQLGLFTPATQTRSVSNGAASDAIDDIKTPDGSSGGGAAETVEEDHDEHSKNTSPSNKPYHDIRRSNLINNIVCTKKELSLSLQDAETTENISAIQRLFLERLDQTVTILEKALHNLYQESFDSTHCLNYLLENQKTLKETYEFLEKEKHDYAEFIHEIFSDVQEHYKSTVTFITAHSTLQLHPSKASDKPALSTPKTTESSKAHTNTILDACLKIYIRELRSKLTEDYTIPLLDFLKKTYQLVRTLRAQDVAEESKQKSFEAIADHLLYFTPLEACLNPDIQTTEITKKITQSLLKHHHSQQHGENALSNAGLLVRLLISNPNLLGDKNILFLLFCLHDCTKRHRPQLPVDSAVFKLRAMRNTFCHPKGQEAAEETSLGLGEKQELINYFASVSLSDQPLPLMHCTR